MQKDPNNFDSPLKFDSFRFAKKALDENGMIEDSQRWPATAMSSTNLAWGYGNHIYPGRFLAVKGFKFILAKLLLQHDISWDRDPSVLNVEGQIVPNLSQKLSIRPCSSL